MNLFDERKLRNKIVLDDEKLFRVVNGLRGVNNRIVVTIGSWDLLHIGHVRYLIQARTRGDVLVVGVDTDRAIKLYKGPMRPVVPQDERCEMLCYQTPVDFVTLVDDINNKGKWQYGLIRKLRPDVFIAVEDSYPQKQREEIQRYCGELVVLPRQAEKTSTSQMIQNTVKKHLLSLIGEAGEKKTGG